MAASLMAKITEAMASHLRATVAKQAIQAPYRCHIVDGDSDFFNKKDFVHTSEHYHLA
jgi:hypothetical protein